MFAPHSTAEHAAGLEARIREADIYIPELMGWDNKSLRLFQQVADGKVDYSQAMDRSRGWQGGYGEFREAQFNALHKSGVRVALIDIPAGHELEKYEREEMYQEFAIGDTFDETIANIKEHMQAEAEFTKRREDYMLEQLQPTVQKVIDANPALKQKDKVNVLLSLGSYHTRVYHEVKRSGVESQRTFYDPRTIVSNSSGEMQRSFAFNKDVSDELAAHVLFESLFLKSLGNNLYDRFGDHITVSLIARKLGSQFTVDDMRAIFNDSKGDEVRMAGAVGEAIRERKLTLPTTPAEVATYLSS